MKPSDQQRALACAVKAARAAGHVMRANLDKAKRVNVSTPHDIKLELDVRCQKLIQKILQTAFPTVALLGEEGDSGSLTGPQRWVVDPIDGTVNFAYGIPHACVSIALQVNLGHTAAADYSDGYTTLIGVVYDPFGDELWTAIRGQPARLNGKNIHVSRRSKLNETIVSIGFAKTRKTLDETLPYFHQLVYRVRKVRIMGAAALALTYVATGRFDAYIERGIRLWDIAAGGLILQCAGGEFWHKPTSASYTYRMIASNGLLRQRLRMRG
jgi:myo-inositol-1(or 4)-monophosphatase